MVLLTRKPVTSPPPPPAVVCHKHAGTTYYYSYVFPFKLWYLCSHQKWFTLCPYLVSQVSLYSILLFLADPFYLEALSHRCPPDCLPGLSSISSFLAEFLSMTFEPPEPFLCSSPRHTLFSEWYYLSVTVSQCTWWQMGLRSDSSPYSTSHLGHGTAWHVKKIMTTVTAYANAMLTVPEAGCEHFTLIYFFNFTTPIWVGYVARGYPQLVSNCAGAGTRESGCRLQLLATYQKSLLVCVGIHTQLFICVYVYMSIYYQPANQLSIHPSSLCTCVCSHL